MKQLILAISFMTAQSVMAAQDVCIDSFSVELKEVQLGTGHLAEKAKVLELTSSELSNDVVDDFFTLLNYEGRNNGGSTKSLFPIEVSQGVRKPNGNSGGFPQWVSLTLRGKDRFQFGKVKDSITGPVARFLYDLLQEHESATRTGQFSVLVGSTTTYTIGRLACTSTFKDGNVGTYACFYNNVCSDANLDQ